MKRAQRRPVTAGAVTPDGAVPAAVDAAGVEPDPAAPLARSARSEAAATTAIRPAAGATTGIRPVAGATTGIRPAAAVRPPTAVPDPAARPKTPAAPRDPLAGYRLAVLLQDALAVLVASSLAVWARWGLVEDPSTVTVVVDLVVLPLTWLGVLAWRGGYDTQVFNRGTEEFKRVVSATVVVFAIVGTASYLLDHQVSRGVLLGALPLGLVLLLLERWLARRRLARARLAGRCLTRTVVVGRPALAAELSRMLGQDPDGGFEVVAIVLPPYDGVGPWLDALVALIAERRADAVALTASSRLGPDVVRRLAWRLEGPRIDLLVSPALGDVAGPRLSVRPAAGLPLLHLDEPELTGPKRFVKRTLDIVGAGCGLALLSPLLLAIALGIKLSSRGPVFFTQDRVGQGGRLFPFPKFRTMVDGAADLRADVIGTPDEDITARYRSDPRITPFGRVLRRWSLDELPQIWSVLVGDMSLVGPRPMLVEELPLLADADHRRHLTKPGLTGLWQISGRKEIDWEGRMRLDLYYVEHWSPALDLVILAKTVKAVATGAGAY